MSNNDIVSTAPVQPASTDLIDLSRLDPARRQQVAVIAQSVQASDSNTIATFGAGPQRKLSGFLDQLLAAPAPTTSASLANWSRNSPPTSRR